MSHFLIYIVIRIKCPNRKACLCPFEIYHIRGYTIATRLYHTYIHECHFGVDNNGDFFFFILFFSFQAKVSRSTAATSDAKLPSFHRHHHSAITRLRNNKTINIIICRNLCASWRKDRYSNSSSHPHVTQSKVGRRSWHLCRHCI